MCDLLGDRMSLIHEYARNREDRIILNLLRSGMKAETVSKTADIPLSRVRSIEKVKNKRIVQFLFFNSISVKCIF